MRYALLSTNNVVQYRFLTPIVAHTWWLQGWKPFVFINDDDKRLRREQFELLTASLPPDNKFLLMSEKIKSVNKGLFTQCVRLYMPGELQAEDTFIIGDADMAIASDFLNHSPAGVTVYGHDLTGYQQYPMCYVHSDVATWLKLMGNPSIMKSDLESFTTYDSLVKHEAWCADQQILTAKIKRWPAGLNSILRGTDKDNLNLPLGRWDRHGNFRHPQGPVHDVHLMHDPQANAYQIKVMLNEFYPGKFDWVIDYAKKFNDLQK